MKFTLLLFATSLALLAQPAQKEAAKVAPPTAPVASLNPQEQAELDKVMAAYKEAEELRIKRHSEYMVYENQALQMALSATQKIREAERKACAVQHQLMKQGATWTCVKVESQK